VVVAKESAEPAVSAEAETSSLVLAQALVEVGVVVVAAAKIAERMVTQYARL